MNFRSRVEENLKNIKNNNDDFYYEICADVSEFSNIVEFGKTYKERLQILIMLYYVNPTLEEIKELDIEQVFNYIKETDEQWNKDKQYFKNCIYLIVEKLI